MNEIINLLNPWWFKRQFKLGIARPRYQNKLLNSLTHKRAALLVGSRRVGKTTLFYQTIAKLLLKTPPQHILYLLMDHPQLSSYKIYDLIKEFRKQFNLNRTTKLYLFLDEVQYLKGWEREVKALLDTENIKIFLSGSASSRLLFKSPYLTGRIEKIEVYPLDFNEFLSFKKRKVAATETYKLEKYTDDYLKIGGYPEYVLEEQPAYFSDLINNVLYKDIVNFYKLKNPDLLKDLLLLLADRVGYQTSYNKLASILSIKIDTVKEYIYYLKNTLLIDELPRASNSRSARIYGPKKFYLSDNGSLFHLLGKVSYSAAFEQTVFNFLKRRNNRVGFYYENQKEIDFIVQTDKGKEGWEVKYKINPNFEEKLESYLNIAQQEKIKKIVFVTKDYEKTKTVNKISVKFVPFWKLAQV